jgi:TRAP-type C4-dicarboxylate transport system permease small subunit
MKIRRWLDICALAAFAVCCGLVCVGAQQAQKQGDKTKLGGARQDNADPG